jgi:hypothetical protein
MGYIETEYAGKVYRVPETGRDEDGSIFDVIPGETDEERFAVARAFLLQDGNLAVPGGRYGADTRDCMEVALLVARIMGHHSGEPMTFYGLDSDMGLVVNSHDDVADLIRDHGPTVGADPADYLDDDDMPDAVVARAREALGYFERRTRDDGTAYLALADDRPEWVHDLVYAGHGQGALLPDDWRYEAVQGALSAIADADESDDLDDVGHEFADANVDVYTSARLTWLGSNLNRAGYCDEAAEELGGSDLDTVERIGLGQYQESREVYGLVLDFLREQ